MSMLVDHARRELAHLLEHEDPMERDVARSVLAAVQGFSTFHGHSGGSAAVAIDWTHRLLNFGNIRPLTSDSAEWLDVSDTGGREGGPLWQSRRCSEAFSEDCGATYYLLSEDRWVGRWRWRRLKRDVHAHATAPSST